MGTSALQGNTTPLRSSGAQYRYTDAVPRIFIQVAGLLLIVGCARQAPRPDVLLISWDTVRADHVGRDGATPTWNELVADGVVLTEARTAAPVTLPAHASLLTGVHPPRHGARSNGYFRLDGSVPTLAEWFRDAGWHTGAFVSAAVLDEEFGLDRGFLHYDAHTDREPGGRYIAERRAKSTVDAALAWVNEIDSDEPVFALVHLFDPHRPWEAPEPWSTTFRADPYLAEIAYTDDQTGRLLDGWSAAGRGARTLVVLLSDHGEGLGEHGEPTHGYFAYDSTVRVPLLFRAPEDLQMGLRGGTQVDDPVSLVDVAPTIAELVGLDPFPSDGVSLRARLAGHAPLPPRELPVESVMGTIEYGTAPVFNVLDTDGEIWIDLPERERYAMQTDPAQLDNLYGPEMADLADELFARHPRQWPPERGLSAASPDLMAQLAVLGYIDIVSTTAPTALAEADADPKERLDVLALVQGGARGYVPSSALQECRRLIERHGRIPSLRRMEVDLLDQLGRPLEADTVLERAITSGSAHSGIRDELRERREQREADHVLAAAIASALENDPGHASAHHDLAVVLTRLGNHDDAIGHYRLALEQDANDDLSRRNLARLWWRRTPWPRLWPYCAAD